MQTGAFGSPREVIHRALESLDADESWLLENRAAINEKIERGFAQFERGEGLTAEESLAKFGGKEGRLAGLTNGVDERLLCFAACAGRPFRNLAIHRAGE